MTIIVAPNGGPFGRDTIPSRPFAAAAAAFVEFRLPGRIRAIFGDGSFARHQGHGGCRRTTGHRASISRLFSALRVCQDFARQGANAFHEFPLLHSMLFKVPKGGVNETKNLFQIRQEF